MQKAKIEPANGAAYTLEEIIRAEGTGTFDQFKDRKSTYKESKYTTSYDEATITKE